MSHELPAIPTTAAATCGLTARTTDSIDRLGFIAIRYRAWIGEALAFPFIFGRQTDARMLKVIHGCFDFIEHIAEDFLVDNGASWSSDARVRALASSLMDEAARMKRLLLAHQHDLGDRLVPSIDDLDLLSLACRAHGGDLRP